MQFRVQREARALVAFASSYPQSTAAARTPQIAFEYHKAGREFGVGQRERGRTLPRAGWWSSVPPFGIAVADGTRGASHTTPKNPPNHTRRSRAILPSPGSPTAQFLRTGGA